MWISKKLFRLIKHDHFLQCSQKQFYLRSYHAVPFLELYCKTTGSSISENFLKTMKKKHPGIDTLSYEDLRHTLAILRKFNITAEDACLDPHVFTMNTISMENYGYILKECGFVKIVPKHIIKYHTIVKSRTIASLKKESLLKEDLNLEELLYKCFKNWSYTDKTFEKFPDDSTNMVTVRMSVLQKYLNWRLGVTLDEFTKYCKYYLPMRHRPMADIQEALDIAQDTIKFDTTGIRRNGFIISSDPMNTKLILENVDQLASIDIREAIRIEPAILKNNYSALLEIRNLLEEYDISKEAQRKCLKVYCMRPDTVKERLEELRNMKQYQFLRTNPRVLSMVVHKKKMMNRLDKIYAANKQCYSLNHLISSSKVFNNYISNFGDKVCGRDLAVLISSSLSINKSEEQNQKLVTKEIIKKLRRHKFWLHAALSVIDENIQFLKTRVNDEVILNNCQLLLYPTTEVENYVEFLIKMREGSNSYQKDIFLDMSYNNLNHRSITDDEILSLVLYEIEKKYHFSGDGIWCKPDGAKMEAHAS